MRASGDTRLVPSCAPAQRALAFQRRGWDSNPRTGRTRSTAFKAAAFNRSATPPGTGCSLTNYACADGCAVAATGRAISVASRRRSSGRRPASSSPRSSARAAERGLHGARARARALVHRRRAHRRGDDPLDRARPGARRSIRAAGLVKVEAGIVLARPQPAPRRARPGVREPRRHRPPDARRRDLDRHPRHRRRACATSRPRSRRSSWCSPTAARVEISAPTDPAALARGAGRPRRARDRSTRSTLRGRPRLHARPRRPPAAARRDARRASTSSRRPTTTSSSTSSPTPRRRSAARRRRTDEPPQPRAAAAVYAQEVVLENWVGRRLRARRHARFPARSRASSRLAAAGTGRATKVDRSFRVFASERRVRFTEMEYGIPREHAAEAVRRVLEIAARPEHRVAFPIEVRFAAGDDVAAQPRARARHRLHRRPPGPQARLGALLPRRSRRSWTPTAAARTGASATSRPRRRWRRATRAGTTSSGCERDSTRRASSATRTSSACSDHQHEQLSATTTPN